VIWVRKASISRADSYAVKFGDFGSWRAKIGLTPFKMVGRVGIEPTTGRLKAECSTSELTPHLGVGWSGCHPKDGGIIPQNHQITSAIWRSPLSRARRPPHPFVAVAVRPAWRRSNLRTPSAHESATRERCPSAQVRSCSSQFSAAHRAPFANWGMYQ
jgi:hypothetical protein